jgi:hypothetical protein
VDDTLSHLAMSIDLVVNLLRRSRNLSLVAAGLGTLVPILEYFAHAGWWVIGLTAVAPVFAWRSVFVASRSLRAIISIRPANER